MRLLLDLYCGTGGWSIGFHREGFECIGVDIIDVGYPYTLLKNDIREFHYLGDGPDVVVASPPCTEFSPITKLSAHRKQRGPPDPNGPKGLGLVKEAWRIIGELQPKFWCIENVFGSRNYIEPLLGKPRVVSRPYLLWGNFPEVMWPDTGRRVKGFSQNLRYRGPYVTKRGRQLMVEDFPFDPLRAWKRAKIPIWVSQTVAQACVAKLTERKE